MESLDTIDIVCIVIYFLAVLAVGIWSTCRPGRNSAAGHFLAGKNVHWILVGASLFASGNGAQKFIGFAGLGAASGFAVIIYEWHGIYLLLLLGWIFVPVYVASGTFTMPEYLKKRFGGVRLRLCLSILNIVLFVIVQISSEMYAGAIFLNQILGANVYVAISILLIITAIYTVVGGLAAVIYTDTLQSFILPTAATILFVICMVDIGGWDGFLEAYSNSASNHTLSAPQNFSCGLPRSDFMHMWRDPIDGDIPWTGAVFGLTTMGLWNYCTNQIIVQRSLAAKNMNHAKAGTVLAALLKILPFFLYLLPGMMSRSFYPDKVACSDPDTCKEVCENPAGCTNIAYTLLIMGLKGIMISAFMTGIISTLAAVFNSASYMFTMDIWRRFRRKAKQSELVIVGKVFAVILVVISIMWIPMVEASQGGKLWNYLQTVASCISPPWCWLFLLALFWKGTTEKGAFWGLLIATGVGVIRMVMEFVYTAPFCGSGEEDTRPDILKKVHFLHFAIISSVVSIVSTVAISLCTKRRAPEKLRRVTWWTRHTKLPPEESDSETEDDLGLDDVDPEDDSVEKEPRPPPKRTAMRIAYNWICGQEDRPRPKLTQEEKELIREKMTNIHESKRSKLLNNTAAILTCLLGVFLFYYFA